MLVVEVVVDRETGRSDAIQGMKGQELGGRNITVDQANYRPRRWRA